MVVRGSMGPGLRSHGCYDRLDGKFSVTDASGTLVAVKTLLYILESPRLWRVSPACAGLDGPEIFSYQVDSVFGEVLPLRDGTFLVIDSVHGIVVRFQSNFATQARLLNSRLFVMDANALEEFWASNFRDDELDKLQKALYRKLTLKAKEK
jgi:hypothetical protein